MDNRTTSLNLVYMHAGVHQRAVRDFLSDVHFSNL